MPYDNADVAQELEPQQEESAPSEIAVSSDAPDDNYSFEAMRLKVGDRLQVQLPPRFSNERVIVKLIGYVNNFSLLITPPRDENGLRITVEEGESLLVRVFSSQNAFFFSTTVEKLIRVPFEYLHISFPQEVKGMTVRKAPRVKTKVICSFARSAPAGESVTGVLANMSANGALLIARNDLLEKDEEIKLTFRLLIHGTEIMLSLVAVVRSRFSDDTLIQQGTAAHGLEFIDPKPNDTMLLQSMVYQQIIEQPMAVI